jgi:hypothetical protein
MRGWRKPPSHFFAVPIGDPHDRINQGTLLQANDKDD